ncbi:MAG: hypothetical protein ABIP74_03475 [Candidatus Saccharimonas sp.]
MERLEKKSDDISRNFSEWLGYIDGENRQAIERFMADRENLIAMVTAPGSREAHQDWQGGWLEHERQTFMVASKLYDLMQETGVLDELSAHEWFTFSDCLTVLFLHDIEKPFIYGFDTDGSIINTRSMTKKERKEFRQGIIEQYGFEITPTMENALLHVEGVRDEYYQAGKRADQPLAALCHAADNMSARVFYNHGLPQ